MFTTIKPKEILSDNEEILISTLFSYIEKNLEDKIISYIKNPSYKIWEKKDENYFTILHKSCFLNNTSLSLSIILETKKRLGYNSIFVSFINSKTEEGLTPLHYTAYNGNLIISKCLIENGADPNAVTNLGKNIIHLSAEGNQPSLMIFFLFKKIIDISTKDNNNSTPLHWACFSGAYDSVKFLISLNAEINAMDKNELTPLHIAVLHGRKNIVIKLLQYGAIKEIENSRGEIALYLAWKKKYKEIYNILNKKEFYPLWSIKEPLKYVEPNDIYKIIIIAFFLFHEFSIIFIILPFLKNLSDILFNNILFLVDFLLFIILIKLDPGYKKSGLINNRNNTLSYPLMDLIEQNIDIRNYCPKCFVPVVNTIKHCIICKKCVEGFSHHCFWINKCIGKKNILIYFIFILITLIFALDSIYICFMSLFDFSYIPYNITIYKSVINTLKERQIRVVFSSLIGIYSIFISFPLNFLLANEIFKFFKNKNFCKTPKNKKNKDIELINKNFELEVKNNIIDEDDDADIFNNNFLGINRESTIKDENQFKEVNIEESFSQGSKNNILSNPQTPFLDENNSILFNDHSEE